MNQSLLWMDYRYVLPTLAKLPASIAVPASYGRGLLQAAADYDWRSIGLGKKYIRANVYQAMKALTGSRSKSLMAVLGRFMHNSRTEYQDHLYRHERKIETIFRSSSAADGIDAFLNAQQAGRGTVMLTCHFDSFIMGMVLLGKYGLKTNVLTSAVVEDSRVHPDVRTFFYQKYRCMETYTGGKMEHCENGLDFYHQALVRGEVVVITPDVQGTKSNVEIPFLGRSFRLPVGAWHMAKKSNGRIGAYMCRYVSPNVYRMVFLPPAEIDPESPVQTLRPIYAFFEEWIRKMPERWLAAEHWVHYGR
jgi:lauroyl/myristoyl acyltransferase